MRLGREWSLRTPSRAPRARFPQVLRALAADGTLRLAGAAALLRRAGSAPLRGQRSAGSTALAPPRWAALLQPAAERAAFIYTYEHIDTCRLVAHGLCEAAAQQGGGGGEEELK